MKNGKNNHGNAKRKVKVYPLRKEIELAPGMKIAPLPSEHVPEIAIARLQPMGDGTYRPVIKIYEADMRVTEAARLLNVDYRMLSRLARAGFIKSSQPSPNNHQISLASWFEHVDAVRADPEFWLKEKNRQRYREAL